MRKTLLLIFALVLAAYVLPASAQNYVKPPSDFLSSLVVTPLDMNNFPLGEYSVQELEDMLATKRLDNGTFPEILGWTRDDNIYTLHFLYKRQSAEVVLTHLLDDRSRGRYSYLKGGWQALYALVYWL